MSYITFKNICKSYDNKTQVLKGIDLEVEEGELLTLLGPSGCGKSTLLRCLAGLEQVQQGHILLEGRDITDLDARQRQIGMVFQQYSLFPNMTVEQNMAFGLKIQRLSKAEINDRITEALAMVGLQDKADAYPAQLSGGQQQRVALARAIVTRPKVLLLDEPLSAIDAKLRKSLQVEIRRIQNLRADELFEAAKQLQVPVDLVEYVHENGKLPVVNFAAGGVATPADAALMMQLGAEGVFVGSGIFKSGNPAKRAASIVKAVTNYTDAKLIAELSTDLGEAMVGINEQEIELLMAERGK